MRLLGGVVATAVLVLVIAGRAESAAPASSATGAPWATTPEAALCPDGGADVVISNGDSDGNYKVDVGNKQIASTLHLASDGTSAQPVTVRLDVSPQEKIEGVDLWLHDRLPESPPNEIELKLEMPAKGTRLVDLVGSAPADRLQLGRLTVNGCIARTYLVNAGKVAMQLGLQQAEWVATNYDLPPLRDADFEQCIPTDVEPDRTTPRIAVQAPAGSDTGLRLDRAHLEASFDTSHGCPHGLWLHAQHLPPGVYVGTLDVNGEKLRVVLTAGRSFWVPFLVVMLAGLLSAILRFAVQHNRQRARNEDQIDLIAGNLKNRPSLFPWDDLQARNLLRRARSRNTLLGLAEFTQMLKDASAPPPERQFKQIDAVFLSQRVPLPIEVRDQIGREWSELLQIISSARAQLIPTRLECLEGEARAAFHQRVQNWLTAQESELQTRISAAPEKDLRDLPSLRNLLNVFLLAVQEALERFVGAPEDAIVQLAPQQAALLDRIAPTVKRLDERLAAGETLDVALWRRLLVGDLTALEQPPPQPAPPLLAATTDTITLASSASGVFAGAPVTLLAPEAWRNAHAATFLWTIRPPTFRFRFWRDAEIEYVSGEGMLTYVFEASGRHAVAVQPVGPTAGNGARTSSVTIAVAPPRSLARRLRLIQYLLSQTANLFAVTLAALIVVATFWAGKAFGASMLDYVSLVAVGLGVDNGVGSGPRLISALIARFKGTGDDTSEDNAQ